MIVAIDNGRCEMNWVGILIGSRAAKN